MIRNDYEPSDQRSDWEVMNRRYHIRFRLKLNLKHNFFLKAYFNLRFNFPQQFSPKNDDFFSIKTESYFLGLISNICG